ncbi:hypothetical protein I312_106567 [Cryptococcus bacillisporus CA1280]|uniref:uncharacterized protein n=1 Tax=Cryptococcus bacillisporus CA1280 TaxID=1296109 RepID=UPI003365BFE0
MGLEENEKTITGVNLTDVELKNETRPEHARADLDVAGRFLGEIALKENAAELLAPCTDKEAKQVRRKADCIILPLLMLALMMGAVDKNALSTAAVLGLRTDLKLSGTEYSWAGSIIFFGQLASVFPALFMMQRLPAGYVVSGNVLIWGIITLCIVACKNATGLLICRFILGFFESISFPGYSLILTSWYTRREQTVRTAVIFNTMSTIFNGLIAFGCSYASDHIAISPWKLQFLINGALTTTLGVAMCFLIPNSPTSAWWLSERQRVIAVLRLRDERTGMENKVFKKSQLLEALRDYKTWIVLLFNICLNVPTGGINSFNSIIVKSLGFNVQDTMLLSIPNGALNWMAALFLSFVVLKTRQRVLGAALWTIIPLVATVVLHLVPRSNKAGSLVGLLLMYVFWAPYVVMIGVVNANTAGYTKKTIVYGTAYCGYLIGNLIGPQLFFAREAPNYPSGVTGMLTCYCLAIALLGVYYVNIRRLIRKKKEALENDPDHAVAHDILEDWYDQTDFENVRFRYVI